MGKLAPHLLVIAGVLAFSSLAYPQNINNAVDMEDLGLTSHLFPAARPMGLAGAYTAAGDDIHAIVYNPAGLSRIRRIEVSMGFQYERNEIESTFFRAANSVAQTSTNLDYISGAYPFPTYRGSLVGAFGIYREYSSYMDLLNRGFNANTQTLDDYILQQSGSIFSYNFGFGFDLSPTLSGGASFFVLDGTVNALTQWSYAFPGTLNPGDLREHFLLDDLEADVDGYGGRFGVQVYPHRRVCFGVSVTTPTWIYLDGTTREEEVFYYEDDPDEFEVENWLIDIDYRLPFRIDMGVSYTPEYLLFSLDVGYADWTQASANHRRLSDSDLRPIFREVVDVRAGVELNVPEAPLRIRGGYAYTPYPLTYLQEDRIEWPLIQKADVVKDRQLFTVGIGGLIGRVLSVDAAYLYSSGKRSIPTLIDERAQHAINLSASYRF